MDGTTALAIASVVLGIAGLYLALFFERRARSATHDVGVERRRGLHRECQKDVQFALAIIGLAMKQQRLDAPLLVELHGRLSLVASLVAETGVAGQFADSLTRRSLAGALAQIKPVIQGIGINTAVGSGDHLYGALVTAMKYLVAVDAAITTLYEQKIL